MESHNEKTFFALDKQRTPESGRGSGQVPRCSGSERVAPAGQRGVGQAAALVGGGGGRADEHVGQESEDRAPE